MWSLLNESAALTDQQNQKIKRISRDHIKRALLK